MKTEQRKLESGHEQTSKPEWETFQSFGSSFELARFGKINLCEKEMKNQGNAETTCKMSCNRLLGKEKPDEKKENERNTETTH